MNQVVYYIHTREYYPAITQNEETFFKKVTNPPYLKPFDSETLGVGPREGQMFQDPYTGEGNGKPLQYSCLENPMNSMKRQNDRTLKEKLPRSVGAQYATGDQWRNNPRKNEGMEPKQKQYPAVDVTGDGSKV